MGYESYRNDVNTFSREARWTFFSVFFKVFLPISIVLSLVGGAAYWLNKPMAVLDRITNPDAMVANYEWYIQQDRDIHAIDQQIITASQAENDFKTAAGPREKWTHDDREEGARLASITTGLKQQRQQMVADYNAKTDMRTRSWLKGHSLPEHYE